MVNARGRSLLAMGLTFIAAVIAGTGAIMATASGATLAITVSTSVRASHRGLPVSRAIVSAKASLRVAAYGATKCNVTLNPAELPPETTTTVPGAVTSTTGG